MYVSTSALPLLSFGKVFVCPIKWIFLEFINLRLIIIIYILYIHDINNPYLFMIIDNCYNTIIFYFRTSFFVIIINKTFEWNKQVKVIRGIKLFERK